MADFQESLTVHIRGDSSDFSRELDRVEQQITRLESRLASVESASQRFAATFDRFGQATKPLSRVNLALDGILQRLNSIGSTSVRINVQPALQSLRQLQTQLASVLAQMRQLQSLSTGGGSFGTPARGYAQGGLVTGRPGTDRIPAMLSAGEFVIREPMVQELGTQFLSALNDAGTVPIARSRYEQPATEPRSQAHVTNLGGVQIAINTPGDARDVLRELKVDATRLRNRRG